jgi:hypothetical protein
MQNIKNFVKFFLYKKLSKNFAANIIVNKGKKDILDDINKDIIAANLKFLFVFSMLLKK